MEIFLYLPFIVIFNLFYQAILKEKGHLLNDFYITNIVPLLMSDNIYKKSLGKILGGCVLCSSVYINVFLYLILNFYPMCGIFILFVISGAYLSSEIFKIKNKFL